MQGEVLIVAGEASGDAHAAGLVRALCADHPGLGFYGMGGPELQAAGMEVIHDNRDLAVMGLAEVVGSLATARRTLSSLTGTLARRQPLAAILVDFPEFNLRLARAVHARGIPVIVFISPQIWAWRSGRVRTVSRYVERVICILPFETGFYRRHGASAVYVGHPLMEREAQAPPPAAARSRLGLNGRGPVLALLPGSRRQEIRFLLPDMLEATRRLRQDPGLGEVLLPIASTLDATDLTRTVGEQALAGVRLVKEGFLDVLAAADAAVVASGTSTLAAAVTDTPMVLGYRVHPLTYLLGRHLTRVSSVGLVNLVAGRRLVAERIQDDFTAENLAREARRLLTEPAVAAAQRQGFAEVRRRLGPPGAFVRAAEAVTAAITRFRQSGSETDC